MIGSRRKEWMVLLQFGGTPDYGIGNALTGAGMEKNCWKRMYNWFKTRVKRSNWMGELRKAGIGDGNTGKNLSKDNNMTLLVRRWAKLYNKHNPAKPVKFSGVIDLALSDSGFTMCA